MATSLRTWLTVLFLGGSILSCIEQRELSLPPQKFRLKTTNSLNFGGFRFNTEYTYDAGNRVISFTTSAGTKGVFRYDEQNRYKQFDYFYHLTDEKDGETTSFGYGSGSITATTDFVKNGKFSSNFQSVQYKLDGNKRLISISTKISSGTVTKTFDYTGDNITHMRSTSGLDLAYEYDDKLNPYYGLIAPDISETRRFSRNNVTKITTNGRVSSESSYEYNAQGLPIKMIEKNGPGHVLYTYEPYILP